MDVGNSHSRLLRFINGLPACADIVEWSRQFQALLHELLPGVDRISVNINRACIVSGRTRVPAVGVVQTFGPSDGEPRLSVVRDTSRDADHFRDRFRAASFPVDDYQTPECFSWYLPNGFYVGSVLLWNRTSSQPVSADDLALLTSLSQFLRFVLTSAIVRFRAAHRFYSQSVRIIGDAAVEAQLSKREREVLMCRLYGLSADGIASLLCISAPTVRRHLRTIGERMRSLDVDDCAVPFPLRTLKHSDQ